MPTALVHMDPDNFHVLGVWLTFDQSAYLRTSDGGAARSLGRETMDNRGSAPSWEEWADYLTEARTTDAMWQRVPRKNGESAGQVLARVVAQEAVSRRNADQ